MCRLRAAVFQCVRVCVTARHTHTSIRAIAHTHVHAARLAVNIDEERKGEVDYRWSSLDLFWGRGERKEWRLLDVAQEGDDELVRRGAEGGTPWQLGDGCVDIRRHSVMQGAFLRDKWWRRQKRESISRRLALPHASAHVFPLAEEYPLLTEYLPGWLRWSCEERANRREAISWGNLVSKFGNP